MMRCPSCLDDYEDDATRCADCGIPLVPSDALPPARTVPDARLGTFHPAVAARVVRMLDGRGVAFTVQERDDAVEIVVDRAWRDDLRAELTLTWSEFLGHLDTDTAAAVLATGGPAPGWYDPPRGGHVDRAGRLVVDVDNVEEAATDASRMIGPALLATGGVLIVVGWQVFGGPAVVILGIGLALIGLFTPR